MRVLVLVFGLLGVACSGLMSFVAYTATKTLERNNPAESATPETKSLVFETKARMVATFVALGLGVVATGLAAFRVTKPAGVAFLQAFLTPAGVLVCCRNWDVGDLAITLAFHGSLGVAGVLALCLKPKPAAVHQEAPDDVEW